MKISNQLKLTALGMMFLGISNLFSVYLNSLGNDSKVVNYAGIVRGGTQRLIKLELAKQPNDKLTKKLDDLVNGLINGDNKLELPQAQDPMFLETMKQVAKNWSELKILINQLRNGENVEAELLKASEQYFELANKAVFDAEKYSTANIERIRQIQISIFALNVIFLIFILLITRKITHTLQDSTSNIANSSDKITTNLADQENIIKQQILSVNQTQVTMDELREFAQQSAATAELSATRARQVLALAEDGSKSVQQTMNGMNILKEKVENMAGQIQHLGDQIRQISNISKLVGDLAYQTNLLALNAAVEASRAGSDSKGFSLVAREIRNLADQSKSSAQKINSLVKDIQSALEQTILVTEEGNQTADTGFELAKDTTTTFIQVTDAVNNLFLNSQQISFHAKQQAVAVQQAVVLMNELTQGSQTTAISISEVRSKTEELNNTSRQLQALI